MADYDNQGIYRTQTGARVGVGVIDEGLRAYMLRVYNYMAAGVAITGVVAYAFFAMAVSSEPTQYALQNGIYLTGFGYAIYVSWLKWVIMLAPLGMVFLLSARIGSMSVSGGQLAFWAFAALMGASLSAIFLRYTGNSVANVFFITAASFGGLSLWAYTTKKDLSGWGSFLFMGLIGVILAMIMNIFLASSALQFAISVIGVLVFAGLTAYDTQSIKEMYSVQDDGTVAGRKAIMGALRLYLDFINLFIMLLSLFGNRQ